MAHKDEKVAGHRFGRYLVDERCRADTRLTHDQGEAGTAPRRFVNQLKQLCALSSPPT